MNSQPQTMLTIVAIIIVGFIAWSVLTMPDQRTTGQKVSDAGVSMKDTGDDIKKNTAN